MKDMFSLVGEVLNNKPVDYSEVTKEELYEFYRTCKAHDIHLIIYGSFSKTNTSFIDEKLLHRWKKKYLRKNLDTLLKLERIKPLFSNFKKNNIEFFILKGLSHARYYPKYSERCMGDIDIYVNKDKIESTCELIKESGYVRVSDEGIESHHLVFKLEGHYFIELHTSLVSMSKFPKLFKAEEYIFTNYQQITYLDIEFNVLKAEHELIYCLMHMYKHYYSEGFGFKQICDLYYILESTTIDWNYVKPKLIELSIYNFTNMMLKIIMFDFGLNINSDLDSIVNINDELLDLFKKDIVMSGVFGQYDKMRYVSNHIADYSLEYSIDGNKSKLAFLFPKRNHLKNYRRYNYVNKSAFLLPVAWIHRISSNIIRRNIGSNDTIPSNELIDSRIKLKNWIMEK